MQNVFVKVHNNLSFAKYIFCKQGQFIVTDLICLSKIILLSEFQKNLAKITLFEFRYQEFILSEEPLHYIFDMTPELLQSNGRSSLILFRKQAKKNVHVKFWQKKFWNHME